MLKNNYDEDLAFQVFKEIHVSFCKEMRLYGFIKNAVFLSTSVVV
jgi:hypothetical protein